MIKKRLFTNNLRPLLIATAVILVAAMFGNQVLADKFDRQIKQLESQINDYSNQAGNLRKRAQSLSAEIAALEAQKTEISNQLVKTEAEIAELKAKIKDLEQKIAQNREVLGDMIVKIYLSHQTTTLERIASSKNLADFMDDEAKLNTIRYNLNNKIKEIKSQKKVLKRKEAEQRQLLETQKQQKAAIIKKEQEKSDLLSQTKNSEAAYRDMISKNNSRIDQLKEEQRLANLAAAQNNKITSGDPNHGGYPAYLDYPRAQDSLVDPWGMYNRECVSYTAWKVHQAYLQDNSRHDMPYWGGHGNAKQWPWSARQAGIPTGYTPRPKSVAIWMSGYYGHAMWVEYIKPNGMVHVSQYNVNVAGRYSEMDIDPNSAIYIYF